jgi:hypothetical protein
MNFDLNRKSRPYVGIPLIILLVVLAVYSMRWGIASLDLWRATKVMEKLASNDIPLQSKVELLEQGMKQLDHAQKFGGNHPDLFDKRGQFYYWQALNLAEVGEERGELLSQASEQYREALKMRPLWPYFWANLVVAKAEWGIFDQEFRKAVRRTVETGPWEPRVQLMLIRVDFIEQHRLDRRSRERIEVMLQRALQVQPQAVISLATELSQMPRVCGMFKQDSEPRQCAPYLPKVEES